MHRGRTQLSREPLVLHFSFVEESSLANYSHQAAMTRLRKLQGERSERGGGCLTGEKQITRDTTSKLPIKCETAVSVTKKRMTMRIMTVMMKMMMRMLAWMMLLERFPLFEEKRGGGVGSGDELRESR